MYQQNETGQDSVRYLPRIAQCTNLPTPPNTTILSLSNCPLDKWVTRVDDNVVAVDQRRLMNER